MDIDQSIVNIYLKDTQQIHSEVKNSCNECGESFEPVFNDHKYDHLSAVFLSDKYTKCDEAFKSVHCLNCHLRNCQEDSAMMCEESLEAPPAKIMRQNQEAESNAVVRSKPQLLVRDHSAAFNITRNKTKQYTCERCHKTFKTILCFNNHSGTHEMLKTTSGGDYTVIDQPSEFPFIQEEPIEIIDVIKEEPTAECLAVITSAPNEISSPTITKKNEEARESNAKIVETELNSQVSSRSCDFGQSKFSCENLPKKQSDQNMLPEYRCRFCIETFTVWKDFKEHELEHVKDEISCRECGKVFGGMHNLHVRDHLVALNTGKTKNEQHKCLKCDETFKSVLCCRHHSSTHFSETDQELLVAFLKVLPPTDFQLDVRSTQAVRSSKRIENKRTKNFLTESNCRVKKPKLNSDSPIQMHLKTCDQVNDLGVLPEYRCRFCTFSEIFINSQELNQHELDHVKEEVSCRECEKSFTELEKILVRDHLVAFNITRNKTKQYECAKCDKTFKSILCFNHHLGTHEKLETTSGEGFITVTGQEPSESPFIQEEPIEIIDVIKEEPTAESLAVITSAPNEISSPTVAKKNEEARESNTKIIETEESHPSTKKFPNHRCRFCLEMLPLKRDFEKHELEHVKNEVSCRECGKSFEGKQNRYVRNHLAALYVSKSEATHYACAKCDRTFNSVFCFNHHLDYHEKLETRKFFNLYSSQVPSQSKVGVAFVNFVCDLCKKNFSSELLYQDHLQLLHRHCCYVCPNKFTDKVEVDRHLLDHAKDPSFSCKECGKCLALLDLSAIKHHLLEPSTMAKLHSTDLFACTQCDKTFKSFLCFEHHMETHVNVALWKTEPWNERHKYPCTFCLRSFIVLKSKHDHESEQAMEMNCCKVCGKRFDDVSNPIMRIHLAKLHNTKTHAKLQACSKCDKSFKSFFCFDYHLKTHCKKIAPKPQENGPKTTPNHKEKDFESEMFEFIVGRDYVYDLPEIIEESAESRCIEQDPLEIIDAVKEETRALECINEVTSGPENVTLSKIETQTLPTGPNNNVTLPQAFQAATINYCKLCETIFRTKELLNDHNKDKHPLNFSSHYSCETCGEKFSQKETLDDHMLSHHSLPQLKPQTSTLSDIPQPVACTTCGITFGTSSGYWDHMKTNHEHRCYFCSKTFISSPVAKSHEFDHIIGKNSCRECGKSFKSQRASSVLGHITMVHCTKAKTKFHKCSKCEKSFKSILCLHYHLESHRMEIPSEITCEICGKIFASVFLPSHIKTHGEVDWKSLENIEKNHEIYDVELQSDEILLIEVDSDSPENNINQTKRKPQKFNQRSKKYKRKNPPKPRDIQKVVVPIETEKKVACEVCGAQYLEKELSEHIKTHGKLEKCLHCQKPVPQYDLQKHLSSHYKEDKPGSYRCNLCDEVWTEEKIIDHIKRSHDHKCTFCSKAFEKKYQRLDHEVDCT